MKIENFTKGRRGEEIASDYLSQKDFEIITKNWHTRWGEIDIIALDRDQIVFVEVKLKIGDRFGTPEEMINRRKIEQVIKTADMFLLKNKKYLDLKKRLDAVCIVMSENGEVERILHYQNITG